MIIKAKVDDETLKKLAGIFSGYIKFVADVKREILSAGSARHFEDEKVLLEDGSKQENLWGGGLDLETGELDFDSMINLRPKENPSREILSKKIRSEAEVIVRKLLR